MILTNKTILITGGTGSMGKTFLKRALSGEFGLPKKLIVLSRDEAKQHYLRVEYLNRKSPTDEVIYKNFENIIEFRIGDVRNYHDVVSALHGVDIVVNAAALKQVPVCEYFAHQAVMTNCMGAQNIVQAIVEHRFPVQTVVGVSTDKACKPVNVMGMTKAIQERIFISANIFTQKTSFICVRYGNVLASRGSVIPLFHEQIHAGGPVTITHPDMTRFLLSLNQAVDTVMAAIASAHPGETYIPIVSSSNMMSVAKALIGKRNIEIKITGIRPGEKMHESLVSEEESYRTYRAGDNYAIQPMLPELIKNVGIKINDFIGEYSSASDLMNAADTHSLLLKHGLLLAENPEAILIYGDTNSCLICIAAKKRKIPIFHIEAGNRSFDQRIPEEINRKIVDHLSDINMALTEHSRRHLLEEGLPANQVMKIGSCMKEILTGLENKISESEILPRMALTPGSYFVVSAHREENVDNPECLRELVKSLNSLTLKYNKKCFFSVHPRTQKKLHAVGDLKFSEKIILSKSLGFCDYIHLQKNAFCVLSDSGTLTEESALLGFSAVMIRDAHERPEGSDVGTLISTNIRENNILDAVEIITSQKLTHKHHLVNDYEVQNVSKVVVRIIASHIDFVNREVWKKY